MFSCLEKFSFYVRIVVVDYNHSILVGDEGMKRTWKKYVAVASMVLVLGLAAVIAIPASAEVKETRSEERRVGKECG